MNYILEAPPKQAIGSSNNEVGKLKLADAKDITVIFCIDCSSTMNVEVERMEDAFGRRRKRTKEMTRI
jgi:hypothetical protein